MANHWAVSNTGMSQEMYEAVFFSQLEQEERYNNSTITYISKFSTPRFSKTSMFSESEMVDVNSRELAGSILYSNWINPKMSDYDNSIEDGIIKRVAKGKPILNNDEFVQLVQTLTNKKKRDVVTSYDFDETTLWVFDIYSSRFYQPNIITRLNSANLINSSLLENVCQFIVNKAWITPEGTSRLKNIQMLLETFNFHGRKLSEYNLSVFSAYQNMCRLAMGQTRTSFMPSISLVCARDAKGILVDYIYKGRHIQLHNGTSTLKEEYKQHFIYHIRRRGDKTLDGQQLNYITHDNRMKNCSIGLISDFFFDLLYECKIKLLFDLYSNANFPPNKDIKSILFRIWNKQETKQKSAILTLVFGNPNVEYGLRSDLTFGKFSMSSYDDGKYYI